MSLAFADCERTAGRLESSEGKVTVEQNGQWQTLAIGECVPIDTRIQVSGGRAVFRLANETLLRTSSSTLLRFSAPEEKNWIRLFDGVLHFITRTPHAFDVQTDYVNAGVKGTEFMLTSNRAEKFGEVVMIEGEVLASNEHGQQSVHGGEAVIARNGQAPHTITVPALRSAVQWTLYYPPLPSSSAPRFQPALAALYRNDTAGALTQLEKLPASDHDADYFALVAAINLHRGDINQARNAIDNALALQPDHAQSLALSSISELVVGNHAEAARLLDRAKNSEDTSVWIARSYLEQARFELAAALKSAQKAAAIAPNSALIQARIAELSLMTGDTKQAQKHANNAITLQPEFARSHAIAGFAFMQQLKFDDAETEFKRANELDTTDPLPRLGLGLIQIRHNRVSEGREQLAIAVALDPGQSLLRSYLGKAYQEENRERLASDQYALAKAFDSADPTPWFYSALLARTQNRPFDALDDLNRSIELNDNRAVYRSRLQLDTDEAARTASQAEIYNELGFNTLARHSAAQAVSTAPSEYGGHRMLAEAYADDPQYDAARASEVLQAQLLQPLSATPILPLLGETNLLATEGAGPSALGFREYNAMFVREKPWLSVSGLGGSNHTGADEVSLSGIYDRFSYALSQYHYETQGYRENNDARYDVLSAYTKFQATDNFSLLLQANRREEDRGNIADQLIVDENSDTFQYKQNKKSALLGAHYTPSPNLNFISVLGYQEAKSIDTSHNSNEVFSADQSIDLREKTSNIQLQGQIGVGNSQFIMGTEWIEVDSDTRLLTSITPLLMETIYYDPEQFFDTPRFRSGYAYWNIKPARSLNILLGSTYAELDSRDYTDVIRNWAPKAGATWQISRRLNIRMTYFETLKKPLTAEASIEPSQIAGFTQLFDDQGGSKSRQHGIGLDFYAGANNWVGTEGVFRKINIPIAGSEKANKEDKDIVQLYWNWALSPWAFSFKYIQENSSVSSGNDVLLNTPYDLTTQKLPLEVSWLSSSGIKIKTTATYINQDGKIFIQEDTPIEKTGDSFCVTDITASYQFQRRKIEVSVGVRNLFNKSFKYQNTDIFDNTPNFTPLIPERTAVAAIKIVAF